MRDVSLLKIRRARPRLGALGRAFFGYLIFLHFRGALGRVQPRRDASSRSSCLAYVRDMPFDGFRSNEVFFAETRLDFSAV